MLSGCSGEGSGKLSDGVCRDLAALIKDYAKNEGSRNAQEINIKLGFAFEQFKRGGCTEKIIIPYESAFEELLVEEQEELGHRLHQR